MEDQNIRFLGRGWRFPIQPDENGRLAYSDGAENIEHSLKVLLLTNPGEREMRFSFGSRIQEMVFSAGGERNLRLLEASISDAIRDWESRVEVLSVRAEPDVSSPEFINVSLEYMIRATNTKANMVFPYYLGLAETI